MPRIALITDSGNDLPPAIIARDNIHVVPLLIHFGEDEHLDLYSRCEAFWQLFNAGEIPRSAAPAPAVFSAAYSQALETAAEAIAIIITGKHSSAYSNAMIAASEFGNKVHVFDSWAISVGVGLLVRRAAELIQQDADVPTILANLEDARSRLRILLYLDSLDAVQRGGRIARAMGAIKRMSAMLSIKIILTMQEGQLAFAGAVRSPQKGMRYITQAIADSRAESVATAHTRAPQFAERLADEVAPILDFPREDILVTEAGPALAVHGGFRAFGVVFIAKPPDDLSAQV